MKALILAAGRGLRMGASTDALPKCLLSLGPETILRFQLRALQWAGVRDVAIVTGFCAEKVRAGAADFCVRFYHNAEYDTTNSLYSFYCAREFARDGTLVLNSDVVFHPALLPLLIKSESPNALLYEPRSAMGDEEMKIALDGCGTVARISKLLASDEAAGENLGLVKFGPATADAAFEILVQQQPERFRRLWLPECINHLAGLHPFRAIPIGGLPWTEIDFPDDLERARNTIYPQCAKALRETC
ncbi:MAG: phosphocholine cytidylyltransferase family protein [Candidatus Sumerlaeia bacterium]|nr:phosphocholine cytidylyltransferase family protein [Candidatus Sumerlaeia bacterium]